MTYFAVLETSLFAPKTTESSVFEVPIWRSFDGRFKSPAYDARRSSTSLSDFLGASIEPAGAALSELLLVKARVPKVVALVTDLRG